MVYELEIDDELHSGELYFVDSGVGIIELGTVSNGTIYEETYFYGVDYKTYIADLTFTDNHSVVRVA